MTTTRLSSRLVLLAAAVVALTLPPPCAALQELQLQDAVLIDDVVQQAAVAWYHGKQHRRTGVTYPLTLPGSLSGVAADVVRFRAGSLRRYGVRRLGEFSVPPGLAVRGGVASRLLAVRANLGNLSSVFDEYAASGGYRIASPVLGLTFYGLQLQARRGGAATATARLEIAVTGAAIRVNFSMAVPALQPGAVPLCMAVAINGSVTVTDVQAGSNTCHVWDQGHFALVLGGAGDGAGGAGAVAEAGDVSKWKLALFGAALGAGGTVLLGLVLVAVVSIQRRKSEVAEMARRAYEEEALRVSMVGHVRAPSAGGSRTAPDALEDEYCATL
uniref:Legume lectin domain-containing protein n=1 Tax=Leersia perrieri TaxID=77586 RepID=A0A0D9W8I9_9ORYZ